jgi:hypothetical protein
MLDIRWFFTLLWSVYLSLTPLICWGNPFYSPKSFFPIHVLLSQDALMLPQQSAHTCLGIDVGVIPRTVHSEIPIIGTAQRRVAIHLYERIFSPFSLLDRPYPDPEGLEKIRRGFSREVDGSWHSKRFAGGGPSMATYFFTDHSIFLNAKTQFEAFVANLRGVFPGQEQAVRVWWSAPGQDHLRLGVVQEDRELVAPERDAADWDATMRLTSDEEGRLNTAIHYEASQNIPAEVSPLGLALGRDGGMVVLFYDPDGRFLELRKKLVHVFEATVPGKVLARKSDIIHMTVGRILELPYSSDSIMAEKQQQQVAKIVERYAAQFRLDWDKNKASVVTVDHIEYGRDERWNLESHVTYGVHPISYFSPTRQKSKLQDSISMIDLFDFFIASTHNAPSFSTTKMGLVHKGIGYNASSYPLISLWKLDILQRSNSIPGSTAAEFIYSLNSWVAVHLQNDSWVQMLRSALPISPKIHPDNAVIDALYPIILSLKQSVLGSVFYLPIEELSLVAEAIGKHHLDIYRSVDSMQDVAKPSNNIRGQLEKLTRELYAGTIKANKLIRWVMRLWQSRYDIRLALAFSDQEVSRIIRIST